MTAAIRPSLVSRPLGTFIASRGGLSVYEPEPAYQQGVQSTGSRTTPDVSLVADPATGAWIADPYNLDPSNPFEVVGGTSLSAPAWAGLFALVNQGRAAVGESTLNSATPTDTQQALYMLPQNDYNVIASGTNGYTASAGYNLVTGLGTPVANLLVPDLIAYQENGTTYSGATVAALQNTGLVDTGTGSGSPLDVFSVFDSVTVAGGGRGGFQGQASGADLNPAINATLAPAGGGGNAGNVLFASGLTVAPAATLGPTGLTLLAPAGVTTSPASTGFTAPQTRWSTAPALVKAAAGTENHLVIRAADLGSAPAPFAAKPPAGVMLQSVFEKLGLESGPGRNFALPEKTNESVLDELASDPVLLDAWTAAGTVTGPTLPRDAVVTDPAMEVDVAPRGTGVRPASWIPTGASPAPRTDLARQSAARKPWLTDILFAIGFCGYGAANLSERRGRGVGGRALGDVNSSSFRRANPEPDGNRRGWPIAGERRAPTRSMRF